MSLSEIISDAIKYPFSDITKFLIVGVIALLAALTNVISTFNADSSAILIIAGIISLIFSILLSGYSVGVIKNAIDNSNEIPSIDFVKNLIDGIKVIIISIVYFIIPIIITLILAAITGAIGAGLNHIVAALGITAIISIIIFLIFAIFEIVAIARFADTGNLGDALSIGEVIEDVKRIGILNIIAFLIIAIIIIAVAFIIVGILGLIPYVGIIIVEILAGGFIILFYNRAIGLLY